MIPIVVIPAFNPPIDELLKLLEQLTSDPDLAGLNEIVVVDDGSQPITISDSLSGIRSKYAKIKVLRHDQNQGKGSAIKTAAEYIQRQHLCNPGFITADADGQHTLFQIKRLISDLKSTPSHFRITARKFLRSTPWRSLIGNRIISTLMKVQGAELPDDTQCGLRYYPRWTYEKILESKFVRYDFETDILARISSEQPPEVTNIDSIYKDRNSSSHFRPLLDSLKVGYAALRFSSVALTSAAIDIIMFYIFSTFTASSAISATYLARACSSGFNFLGNKKFTFKNNDPFNNTAIKYFLLVAVIATLSGFLTSQLFITFGGNIVLIKLLVDIFLFFINFIVQRVWVFRWL